MIIFSTPLPPLPIDKRHLVVENGGSNRSSGGSSGNYGHLTDHHYGMLPDYQHVENDDIYTRPVVSIA